MTTQEIIQANNRKLLQKIMSEEIVYITFTIWLN